MTFGSRTPALTRDEKIAARQAVREPSTVKPLAVGRYGGEVRPQAPAPMPKLTRRQKVRLDVREAARGEPCLVRIPGVCTHDSEKTIWSHAPLGAAGKGRGTKALDLCGAMCCTACDAAIDRQAPLPPGLTREQVELAWMYGHLRSLVRLAEKGLL